MTLFESGKFKSHSGKTLPFKIDCDYLNNDDIDCIAKYISSKCTFGLVIGIPSGGDRLADALEQYVKPDAPFNVLIVDDVLTTGASMEYGKASMQGYVHHKDIIGWVIFARTEPKPWINYMFKTSEDRF
jgi:hypoxanthine phosphoribosyltransferase